MAGRGCAARPRGAARRGARPARRPLARAAAVARPDVGRSRGRMDEARRRHGRVGDHHGRRVGVLADLRAPGHRELDRDGSRDGAPGHPGSGVAPARRHDVGHDRAAGPDDVRPEPVSRRGGVRGGFGAAPSRGTARRGTRPCGHTDRSRPRSRCRGPEGGAAGDLPAERPGSGRRRPAPHGHGAPGRHTLGPGRAAPRLGAPLRRDRRAQPRHATGRRPRAHRRALDRGGLDPATADGRHERPRTDDAVGCAGAGGGRRARGGTRRHPLGHRGREPGRRRSVPGDLRPQRRRHPAGRIEPCRPGPHPPRVAPCAPGEGGERADGRTERAGRGRGTGATTQCRRRAPCLRSRPRGGGGNWRSVVRRSEGRRRRGRERGLR